MSAVYQRGSANITGNLTPMIDMIFLLIVFFVLVSRIVDRERVEMNLPRPNDPAAQKLSEEQRVVLNVLPAIGGAIEGYRLAGSSFAPNPAGIAGLTQQLLSIYRTNPNANVHVRADRGTHFEHVEAAMSAVAQAARTAGAARSRVSLVVLEGRN
jgi:biopolymer transport protein ExbD